MHLTLGEILVRERFITLEQLEEALRTQVLFGGKLGTNLIEAEMISVDNLARALSMQTGFPPAWQSQFESLPEDAAALLPAKMALKHHAVPLGLISKTPKILAVAFSYPQIAAIDEISFAVGCRVKAHVAPDVVVLGQLQKLYGLHQKSRFVTLRAGDSRAGGSVTGGGPVDSIRARMTGDSVMLGVVESASAGIDLPPEEDSSDERFGSASVAARQHASGAAAALGKAARELSALQAGPAMRAGASAQAMPPSHAGSAPRSAAASRAGSAAQSMPGLPSRSDPASRARGAAQSMPGSGSRSEPASRSSSARTPVETPVTEELSPDVSSVPLESEPEILEPEPIAEDTASNEERPDAVLELSESEMVVPAAPRNRPALSAAEALTAVANAQSRDEIADSIIDYLRSSFTGGLVMMVRNDVASNWRGFASGVSAEDLDTLRLPLSSPSVLRLAFDRRAPFRGAPPADGAQIHDQLWRAMRCAPAQEVLAAPILVKDRVVSIVLAKAADGGLLPDDALPDIASLCSSAGAAFARLIRAAKPKTSSGPL